MFVQVQQDVKWQLRETSASEAKKKQTVGNGFFKNKKIMHLATSANFLTKNNIAQREKCFNVCSYASTRTAAIIPVQAMRSLSDYRRVIEW